MRPLLAAIRQYRRNPDRAERAREKRLRKMANGYGLKLIRSPLGLRGSAAKPTYALVDLARNTLLLADPETRYGITLDEIEQYLEELAIVRAQRQKAASRG
jgi:hypothetical protein